MRNLLTSVFDLKDHERALTILVDLPSARLPENPKWADRRRIAAEWYTTLSVNMRRLPFAAIMLCTYENVGTNNNDLPAEVLLAADSSGDSSWVPGEKISLESALENSSVVLAPTELSATAPLKNLARSLHFRGATLPGFSREMIPALTLDYEKIHERVMQFKSRLDRAAGAIITLAGDGKSYRLDLDLRHRTAHASGGLIREIGTVANLPSGEAYIVPYEGEKPSTPSRSSGLLPVQFENEIVVYRIEQNKAVDVVSIGTTSEQERQKLLDEPAYGNIAELGIGILGEWGVTAMGSILLDEKLGLHIAFGRSEHFGGVTGPSSFRSPANVIHIDRVYVPSSQPRISVQEVSLIYEEDNSEVIMRNDKYVV
ncbi:MAG: hypothetical protein AAB393_09765 [Bacteroidota bacterium]